MLGFIVAAVAGFFAPLIGGPVVDPIVKALAGHIKIEPSEKPLMAFMIAMLAAGVASAVLESGTAFWVILGGVLGYFGTRIVEAAKKFMEKRNASE